jgi:hypothetical protein
MAVSQGNLKSDLLDLFAEMDESPMSRNDYAEKWSALLVKHLLTLEVPAGKVVVEVVGDASGVMNTSAIPVK